MIVSSITLGILGALDIIPGLIHIFAPDGGASSIAGFTDY